MTALEPQVVDAGRYSANETAEALGIHRNSLKNYTEQGLIRPGVRIANGRKFYTGAEIKKFWKAKF